MVARIAAVIAAAAIGGTCLADSVDLRYTGTGRGAVVRTSLNGRTQTVFAGQLVHEASGGTGAGAGLHGEFITFCVDLLERVSRQERTYDVVDVSDVPGEPMGGQRAAALASLIHYAGTTVTTSDASGALAAAFQLAVWEIIYDFDLTEGASSLDLTDGAFSAWTHRGRTLRSSIQSHIDAMFTTVIEGPLEGAGQRRVTALANEGAQDQIIITGVPLPGAAGLGLAGLSGLFFARRRWRG